MTITLQKKVSGPSSTLREYLKKRLSINRPKRPPLETLNRTRVFISAKAAGISTSEAKALSAVSGSIGAIMNSPAAQPILQEIERREELKDKAVVDRLVEMWKHKKVRLQKVGDSVESIEEDDTDMWKFSMDKVLQLKGYTKDKEISDTNIAMGGVTFNVLQVKSE